MLGPFRAKLQTSHSLATVTDPPVRRYGGLKDQDRIFTNIYCHHNHVVKGAMVRFWFPESTIIVGEIKF